MTMGIPLYVPPPPSMGEQKLNKSCEIDRVHWWFDGVGGQGLVIQLQNPLRPAFELRAVSRSVAAVEMSKSLLADSFFFFSQTSRFCSPTTSSQREEVKDRMISCSQVCVVEEMTVKNKLDLYARMANGVIFLTLALFSRGKCQLGSTAKTNF